MCGIFKVWMRLSLTKKLSCTKQSRSHVRVLKQFLNQSLLLCFWHAVYVRHIVAFLLLCLKWLGRVYTLKGLTCLIEIEELVLIHGCPLSLELSWCRLLRDHRAHKVRLFLVVRHLVSATSVPLWVLIYRMKFEFKKTGTYPFKTFRMVITRFGLAGTNLESKTELMLRYQYSGTAASRLVVLMWAVIFIAVKCTPLTKH